MRVIIFLVCFASAVLIGSSVLVVLGMLGVPTLVTVVVAAFSAFFGAGLAYQLFFGGRE